MTAINKDRWDNPMENYILIKVDSSSPKTYLVLHRWLREHATGKWATTATRVGFEKEEDVVLFKLAFKR